MLATTSGRAWGSAEMRARMLCSRCGWVNPTEELLSEAADLCLLDAALVRVEAAEGCEECFDADDTESAEGAAAAAPTLAMARVATALEPLEVARALCVGPAI
eukprot:2285244-Prymnesium_polylepis.1